MTLKDFEKNIGSQMLEKGFSYFQNGNVISVDEVAAGVWVAEVEGTDNYSVTIRTDKHKIKDWECDCPYDMGPVCKHVIAVFYAIAEEIKIPKEQTSKKSNPEKDNKKRLDKIFKTTTKEELQNFIIAQFSKERSLKNSFVAYFADLLEEHPEEKYKTIVTNLYKAAQGRNGFIDYHNVNKFANSLIELAKKGEEIFVKGNIIESLIISKTLIENICEFFHEVDDSQGRLSTAIEISFNTFSGIVSKAPPMLKDELFVYCVNEYQKEKYHDFGFEENFLELLPSLISTEEQETDFFELINKQI